MGKLIKFRTEKLSRAEASCEKRLKQLYWDNAHADVDSLLRLYLIEHCGSEVYPDLFSRELRGLRDTQCFTPSIAEIELKPAFEHAIVGGVKGVKDVFEQERQKWHEQMVSYADENYVDGVIKAIISDDSEILDVMIDKLMKEPKSLRSAESMVKKRGSPVPVARSLTTGLMNRVGITGQKLRNRIESMAGVKLANECKQGKIVAQTYGDVLNFGPRK